MYTLYKYAKIQSALVSSLALQNIIANDVFNINDWMCFATNSSAIA